jgi:hypothetical protein
LFRYLGLQAATVPVTISVTKQVCTNAGDAGMWQGVAALQVLFNSQLFMSSLLA